jgi:uncharacterized membrane protein YsdA (DUF1294 family)
MHTLTGLLTLYSILSIITFIAYGIDKTAAINNDNRIKESHLHILALAGGWPGAIIAQRHYRHKTQKRFFRFVFWLTVIFNVVITAIYLVNHYQSSLPAAI